MPFANIITTVSDLIKRSQVKRKQSIRPDPWYSSTLSDFDIGFKES